MLHPSQMSKVIITGPKTVQEEIIKELHRLKILHIMEHSKNELADIGMPMESASKLSDLLVRTRALISALGIKKEGIKYDLKRGLQEIEPGLKRISEEARASLEELRKAEDQVSRNESIKQELELLEGMEMPLEALTTYKTLSYFAGYAKDSEEIKKEMSKITDNFMLFFNSAKKRDFVVLFVDIRSRDEAFGVLQRHKFSPLNLANIAGLKGTAKANLKKITDQAASLNSKIEKIKAQLAKLANENSSFLWVSENFLDEQLEKAEAPLKFASTKSSFLVKGWIPTESLHASIDRLNKVCKNKIYVNFDAPSREDKVPVKLKNPSLAKPFEFFIDLYSFPNYREIDPTFFMFLTFPIFFGIMLGDIGYGLISLLFFWILKKKMPKAKNFFNILMLASFVTILFGFLFGEFFGYEVIHSVISREHEIFKLLYISIAIGLVHLNIGVVLGFINEMSHGFRHAFFAKGSWFVLEAGILLLALSMTHVISASWLIGLIVIILSLVMLAIGEGLKGPIESISLLTNTLSYARLMAIGLSSVILAVIVNEQSKEFFHKGGFFILVGILILVIGHAINIMLGLLGSFLHSLRLHYVEFFSKFFHGGAKRYQPFGAKED